MYDSKFVDDSVLDILIPQDSEYDVEGIISSNEPAEHDGPDESGVFPQISQRGILYFDELISIYVVLRTSLCEELELKSLVSRLAIVLEAHAIGSPSSSNGQDPLRETSLSQNKEIVWTAAVDTAEEPLIIIQQKDSQNEIPYVYVIWKLSAFLNRPRLRLRSPAIVFKPSAVLKPAKNTKLGFSDDPYLASGIPASINLLESLKDDSVFHGFQPRLSALRLSQIGSITEDIPSDEHTLKVLPQNSLLAIPSLTGRVRYSKSSTSVGKPTVFAVLDIETAPFSEHDVIITAIKMNLSEGSAEDLSSAYALKLPMSCRPKDNPSFLFHLIPTGGPYDSLNNNATLKTLDVNIEANVAISETCRPRIELRWKTVVDFSIALNPSYGAPGQPLQRTQRPTSLSITSPVGGQGDTPALINESDSAEEVPSSGQQRTTLTTGLGVTITFTAPNVVQVGEPFHWDIFLVNRSNKPRRLAILVIPKRKRGDFKSHLSKPSTSSTGGRKDSGTAEHFVDENLLYAMQKNTGREPPQIVSLSTDLKIGPLNPGSCHNAELRFLPLAIGVLEIEAIRVVDVVSNESIDIRDLPDIVASQWVVDE